MSAKKQTAKKAAKPAAKSSAAKPATETVEAGTQIVFTGFRVPIEGDTELNIGDKLFISSFNDDDGSYNVSKTEKGKAIDTLYREEFRLATETAAPKEVADSGKPGTKPTSKKTAALIKGAKGKTDAEADAGASITGKSAKDAEGRTVKKIVEKPVKAAKPAPEPAPAVKLLAGVKTFVTESGGLIEAAEALADRVGSTEYTLGGILGKIAETAEFEKIVDAEGNPKYGTGQPGMSKFCELHLGVKYRKAQYLINNYIAAVTCGVTEKQMAGIGWSKFKEMIAVLTADNKDELLAEAKKLPYDEFKVAMKKRKVDGGGKLHGNTNTADLRTFTFKLHNDKGQVLVEALDRAKKTLGIEGDDAFTNSQALDLIVSEWLSMKD